ncbi:MAG TPA: hypothetical protein EYP59_08365 [Thiotrichaceae bacterium]|nr:hypothetical protein [Thiotrichaceae bacterium]
MDEFSSLQGRAYELGGLAGAMGALRAFDTQYCKDQMARIISQLGQFNLSKIITQFCKEFDTEMLNPESVKSAPSILSARLFQGYVQGFCETQQFIKALPGKRPLIAWVYANPTLGQDSQDAFELAQQALPLIADCSDFNFETLRETGQYPYADLLFIVRTFHNRRYQFHLICYELSTHNAPTIDNELNLSQANDIYASLRRGLYEMMSAIKTREFRIASETLGLEVSPDLKKYFRGLLTEDKKAKKLFQGGGYLYSLYETLKDRIVLNKPFDKWLVGQNQIEFHVVSFTDRGRHFLHLREDECELLREMGTIYHAIKGGRAHSPEEEAKIRESDILKTQEAILRQIGKNVLSVLKKPLRELYKRAKKTFAQQHPLQHFADFENEAQKLDIQNSLSGLSSSNAAEVNEHYLNYAFSEKIEGYCPTAISPTLEQLEQWLPPDLAQQLGQMDLKSMQDAHAQLIKTVWQEDDIDIYVLSGTPGIGKTTALRNILANYPSGYLLIYLSPRIQVNTDLMVKFDPRHDGNKLRGQSELICINTNASLIKAAESHHGKAALSCYSQIIPDDAKFLFLSPEEAEALETHPVEELKQAKKQSPYQHLEIGAVGEVAKHWSHGVFKTLMQGIYRLNTQYGYKRIVACVATQSNRQLTRQLTTVGKHLKRMFGESERLDIASIEQFAQNVKEIVFFVDEVTGDGAGRQTVQEIILFRKKIAELFEEREKTCPLKFRIIIADASLINAASVTHYFNETQPQPDQILFHGDADRKSLSIEATQIMGLSAKVINANVYPASSLTLKWRPILDFVNLAPHKKNRVGKGYRDLETSLLMTLAAELVARWRQKPREQTIVIIQNKKSVEALKAQIIIYTQNRQLDCPDILCLHAFSKPQLKREIVSPAEETESKPREVPISQKGDLYDIIIMTSSGTRGISFPNASKIICFIPTFSLENNFMEFLQGMYRGRGSGKGNELDREIELIIPQMLVAPPESSSATEAKQISNLFATLMLMRMSIFTRLFGACNLFGQSISCIPIAGQLVEGAAQTTMDQISNAIESLERAQKQNPSDTALRYVTEHIRDIFNNEMIVLQPQAQNATTLAAPSFRNRLISQFVEDANRGLDVIANKNYLPEGCYTLGELILQQLDIIETPIQEKNKHLFDTHILETHRVIKAICVKLKLIINNKDTAKAVSDPAKILYPILNEIAGGELESETESEMTGSTLNRWLVFPISGLHINQFWKDQVEPLHFKMEMKTLMMDYLNAYLCQPNHVLPIQGHYDNTLPPWLLVRGPELEQQLNAQFQTRYFISSKSLALLNIMLLSKHADTLISA